MTPSERLIYEYPDCHKYFGDHRTSTDFAVVIEGQDWTVLNEGKCWVLADDQHNGSAEVHWFCPFGANIKALRRMIGRLLVDYKALVGCTPTGHPNERKAKVLNMALGAEKFGDFYVLTRERYQAYNAERKSIEV